MQFSETGSGLFDGHDVSLALADFDGRFQDRFRFVLAASEARAPAR
jgi:hypothetical protein